MTNEDIIKTLRQLEYPYPTCEEQEKVNEALYLAIKALENEPKKGKWIRGKIAFYDTCPFCNTSVRQYICEIFLDEGEMNFCPNCGADMREADNDNDHDTFHHKCFS